MSPRGPCEPTPQAHPAPPPHPNQRAHSPIHHSSFSRSHRDCRTNSGVMLISLDHKVFKLVIEDRSRFPHNVQSGHGERFTTQLQITLFEVVVVNMAVTAGPHEVANDE